MSQPMSVNAANQFIGSKISLISKAEIRYEGTLYALDLRESTISLAKVRSFGTEDRPTERPIPMKDDLYDYIVFRGSDIKTIDVLEPPKTGSTMACGLPQDPAIIEVSHYRSSMGHHNCGGVMMDHPMRYFANRGGDGVFEGLLRGGGGRGGPRGGRRSSQENGDRRRSNSGRNYNRNVDGRRSRQDGNYRGGAGGGSRGGRGNTPNRGSNRGGDRDRPRATSGSRKGQKGIIQAQQPPKVTFEDPFDFDKANEEMKNAMEKLKITDEEKKDGEAGPEKEEKKEEPMIYYDKDKFFDNISCEALERAKGSKQGRPDWRAERKLNAETFGLQWNPNQSNQRNGQRSFNRGRSNGQGRSGYRGGNNQVRYSYNYNSRYNNRNNYGSRGQQQRT